MSGDDDEEAYCRRQAARSRRLARDIAYGYPEVAKALESLAAEFEERAERLKAQASNPHR
jgi:hypothetical protein